MFSILGFDGVFEWFYGCLWMAPWLSVNGSMVVCEWFHGCLWMVYTGTVDKYTWAYIEARGAQPLTAVQHKLTEGLARFYQFRAQYVK